MNKGTVGLHPPKQGGSEQQVCTREITLLCWGENEINSGCKIWLGGSCSLHLAPWWHWPEVTKQGTGKSGLLRHFLGKIQYFLGPLGSSARCELHHAKQHFHCF